MVVHLTDQSIAEVNCDSLDRLILSGWLQDFQQQLVNTTILELKLLWYTEVTQSQAAVPLDLVRGKERTHGVTETGTQTEQMWIQHTGRRHFDCTFKHE